MTPQPAGGEEGRSDRAITTAHAVIVNPPSLGGNDIARNAQVTQLFITKVLPGRGLRPTFGPVVFYPVR